MDRLPSSIRDDILELVFSPLIAHSMGYLEQIYLWHSFWPSLQSEWRRTGGLETAPASAPATKHAADDLVQHAMGRLQEDRRRKLAEMAKLMMVARDWYFLLAWEVDTCRGRLLHALVPLTFPLQGTPARGRTMTQRCRGYEISLDRCSLHILRKLLRHKLATGVDTGMFIIWAFSHRSAPLEHQGYKLREQPLVTAPPPRIIWDIFASQVQIVRNWPRSRLIFTAPELTWAHALRRHGPVGPLMASSVAMTSYEYGLTQAVGMALFGMWRWRNEPRSRKLFILA
jgi:hypothetical protein